MLAARSALAIVLLIFLFYLALFLIPLVAAAPQAPLTLVVDVVGYADTGGGSYVARLNVTVQASPDDPMNCGSGNVSPCFGYSMCGFAQSAAPATVPGTNPSYLCSDLNISLQPIGQRPGWFYAGTQGAIDSCVPNPSLHYCAGLPPQHTYNVTAWNGTSGSIGCALNVTLSDVSQYDNDPGNVNATEHAAPPLLWPYAGPGFVSDASTYHACGAAQSIPAPDGVNAIVLTPYGSNETDPSRTNVSWRLSTNDTNQTTGNFTYYLFRSSNMPPQASLAYRGLLSTTVSSPGVLSGELTSFDSQNVVNPLFVRVIARDPLTHQRSDYSCFASVLQGQQYSESACGSMPLPLAAVANTGPAIPGLGNPDPLLISIGIDPVLGHYMYAAIGSAILAFIGFLFVNWRFGIYMGVVGIAVSLGLNLVDYWFAILVFMVSVFMILRHLRTGSKQGGDDE